MGQGDGSGMGAGKGSGSYKPGKMERMWIPALPMPIAVVCCVFNFLIPGLGTLIAGFGSLCCAKTDDMKDLSKAKSCCLSIGVSFFQLVAAVFCFLGFCWSWYWGVSYLITSSEYYNKNRIGDNEGETAFPESTTTTVIVQQPAFVPFKTGQSGTNPVSDVTTQQPVAPPPYPSGPETSYANQMGPPEMAIYPPPITHADGSKEKI